MAKPRERLTYTLDGPLYPVKVRLVTQRYLNKIAASKGETVLGCFVLEDNMIYIAKEQADEAFDHTLGHELYHVFVEQTQGLSSEEEKAEAFGSFLIRLLGATRLKDLLK